MKKLEKNILKDILLFAIFLTLVILWMEIIFKLSSANGEKSTENGKAEGEKKEVAKRPEMR